MLCPHHLPSFVRTADRVTSFRSQLKTYIYSRSAVRTYLIPLPGLYKFITYLLIVTTMLEMHQSPIYKLF